MCSWIIIPSSFINWGPYSLCNICLIYLKLDWSTHFGIQLLQGHKSYFLGFLLLRLKHQNLVLEKELSIDKTFQLLRTEHSPLGSPSASPTFLKMFPIDRKCKGSLAEKVNFFACLFGLFVLFLAVAGNRMAVIYNVSPEFELQWPICACAQMHFEQRKYVAC